MRPVSVFLGVVGVVLIVWGATYAPSVLTASGVGVADGGASGTLTTTTTAAVPPAFPVPSVSVSSVSERSVLPVAGGAVSAEPVVVMVEASPTTTTTRPCALLALGGLCILAP